jgi:hypothetical protein
VTPQTPPGETPVTAAELTTDPTFRGFLASWEADRRCPPELADWVQDRDGESPLWWAAVTAAETPLRPWWTRDGRYHTDDLRGLFPAYNYAELDGGPRRYYYHWDRRDTYPPNRSSDELPTKVYLRVDASFSHNRFTTVFAALVAVLDAFAATFAEEVVTL